MKRRRVFSVIGAVVGSALLVAGCGPGDQVRPLNYKKGVYLGKPHTPLNEQTRDELRARAGYQSGLAGVAVGGGLAGAQASSSSVRPPASGEAVAMSRSSSVRPPSADGIDTDALRQRANRQRQ